jgi:hypothetical protein
MSRQPNGTLDARTLIAGQRSFDPWSSEHVAFLLVANGLGAAIIAAGWYQASAAVALRSQLSWLELCVAGLLLAGTANALWLLRGRQAVTLGRMAVLSARQRAELFPIAAPEAHASTVPPSLVWVAGTTRYHRPDCLLVAGKEATGLLEGDTADLQACEACEP